VVDIRWFTARNRRWPQPRFASRGDKQAHHDRAKKDVPIVFTVVGYDPKCPATAAWAEKAPSLSSSSWLRPSRTRPRIRRAHEDLLLVKKYASAFLGTPLSMSLVTRGVDTLIVTGCTTSGCVRASVVDALSHGFRPIIPHEAVGDRAEEPHEANLFDMDSKYGDVVSLADVLAYFEELKS
jgi:nicotinamidase-related amidase